MTDQQKHLESAIQNQTKLIEEFNNLNTEISTKREQILKYQGIIEYLSEILPKDIKKEEGSLDTNNLSSNLTE
jgi:hypothetical protein